MSQVERESLEVDVLFVGAGPGTLAVGVHLVNQVEAHNAKAAKNGGKTIEMPSILVIEKAAAVGDHSLSGSVINPKAIAELMPDFEEQGFPTEYVCNDASFYMFFRSRARSRAPIVSAQLPEEGLPRRVALERREVARREVRSQAGIDIYPGFAGDQLLDRGRPRRRRAHRRHGRRQARQAEVELPARHGHPRQGHGARRRRARQPHQAARSTASTSQGANPADLRDRHQGDLARQAGEAQARAA